MAGPRRTSSETSAEGAEWVSAPIGDAVNTGLGDPAHRPEVDASGGLESGPGSEARHQPAELVRGAIVEEKGVGTGLQGGFRVRLGLDLHLQPEVRRRAQPGRLDRGGDPARRGDVVVLDQQGVEETGAMVGAPAHGDRVLVENPPAGQRLARVDDLGAGAGHPLHEVPGGGGDARHATEEIEGGALCSQNSASGPGDEGQGSVRRGGGALLAGLPRSESGGRPRRRRSPRA